MSGSSPSKPPVKVLPFDRSRRRGDACLLAMLGDSRPEARLAAIKRLAGARRHAAAAPIAWLLLTDPSPMVRQAAAAGLPKLHHFAPLPYLQCALQDEDPGVRYCAQVALEGIGDAEAGPQPTW